MMHDDRIVYAELFGQQHPMCLTVGAIGLITATFGSLESVIKHLRGELAVESLVELAGILMEGGRDRVNALADMAGLAPALPPEFDLRKRKNNLTPAEWTELTDAVFHALGVGLRQTVEVAPSKKSETTQ